jgi:5'-nucleotidase
MSSAISTTTPMTLRQIQPDIYLTNGTPADCVKLAINVLFNGDERRIDLLASGINHGHNASVNLLYSGTMGACFVAAEHGIPAIGFSIDDHNPDTDLSFFSPFILQITRHLLDTGFQRPVCYNVNAPVGPIQGTQWARQCSGYWEKEIQPHTDDNGNTYYSLIGTFVNREPDATDTDIWCINHHLISIQPVTLDMTDYALL